MTMPRQHEVSAPSLEVEPMQPNQDYQLKQALRAHRHARFGRRSGWWGAAAAAAIVAASAAVVGIMAYTPPQPETPASSTYGIENVGHTESRELTRHLHAVLSPKISLATAEPQATGA